MPSSRARARVGLVTGTSVTTALCLALVTGSSAAAEDVVNPAPGDQCVQETLLPEGLVCADGVVALAPPPADPSPAAEPPAAVEEPAPAEPSPVPPPVEPVPDPPVVVVPPVGPEVPVPGGPAAPGGPAVPVEGAPGPVAGGPGAPGTPVASGPDDPAAPDGTDAGDGETAPGTTLRASAVQRDPASTTRSLLTAATVATLASGDLPTLAAMRSAPLTVGNAGLPLSAYAPMPELALPVARTALAAVQAPLLAVGEDAAGSGGGYALAGLSSRALPGLLVVLATALVAAVGAGNIRLWQDRTARRRQAD